MTGHRGDRFEGRVRFLVLGVLALAGGGILLAGAVAEAQGAGRPGGSSGGGSFLARARAALSERLIAPTALANGITIQRDVEKRGGTLRSFASPGMPHFCVASCGRSRKCRAFTWQPRDGRCTLMRGPGSEDRPLTGAVSGVKGSALRRPATRPVPRTSTSGARSAAGGGRKATR